MLKLILYSLLLIPLAREPKQFWTIDGGEHTAAFADPGSVHCQRLVAFFTGALAGTAPAGKKGEDGT